MHRSMTARAIRWGVCATLLAAAASAQTTWYVDVNAVPPGSGAPESPYASIQYAIDQPTTVSGDTLLVAPGTYLEKLNVFKALTVKSSQGPLSTLLAPSGSGDGIVLGGIGHARLEGFTVIASTTVAAVYVPEGTVRGCIVRDGSSIRGIECVFAIIESTTIVNNNYGILGQPFNGSITVRNSIAWGNTTANVAAAGSTLSASYNAGFGSPANGNVPGDPGLWDLSKSDVHLRPGSPCIDAGDPASPPDPDGSPIDIGALTYDPEYAPGPSPYCTGKLNSQGCTPAIGAIGSASASSPAAFVVTASQEPPQIPGLLFYGFGPRAEPFQGGWHCVLPPTKRIGGQSSGGSGPCTGAFAFDMQSHIQSGADPALVPGALVYCQWWNRDPLDPAGFGTGLSDALYFGIAP